MDRDEFTPDNDGAIELNKSQVIGSFLLETNQQFAKAVKKGVCDLNNPASSIKVRIATPSPSFPRLVAEYEVYSRAFGFFPVVCISLYLGINFVDKLLHQAPAAMSKYKPESPLHQFDIVGIRTGKNDCQGKAVFIG